MKELLKGHNYSNEDGRLYSKKHRVSFKIPESHYGWSGRMVSDRKIQLFSQDKTIRLQIYLKSNMSANLWVASELYHGDQRLQPQGEFDLTETGTYFTRSFSDGNIRGQKFAIVGPDEQELFLEISGPTATLTVAAYEIWAGLLESVKFLPRRVIRPAKISWLHVFYFLYNACVYSDERIEESELNVTVERLKGWWGSPPTKDEFMRIVDESNSWIEEAKKAPYLMDQELDFLLKALRDEKWFDQSQRDKFIKDLAVIVAADQRIHEGEKRFLKKVADSLGLQIRIQ